MRNKITLTLAAFLCAGSLSAQRIDFSRRIALADATQTRTEAIRAIDRAGYNVVYNPQVIDGGVVDFGSTELPLLAVLDKITEGTRLAHTIAGESILLHVDPTKQTARTPAPAPVAAPWNVDRDMADDTRDNIAAPQARVVVRHDTLRTVTTPAGGGVFRYAGRDFVPTFTGLDVQSALARTTPPVFALKTNLVWWAARGTINLGGEIGLGHKTSLELAAGLNRWNFKGSPENNRKMTHGITKLEFRYWPCERFNGHFFGMHAFYGKYNVGGVEVPLLFEKEYRYEGDGYGAGINYGYHLPLAERWGLEFSAGVGVAMLDYKKRDCTKCGGELSTTGKTYFGPTELGVKLVFVIK